MADEIAIIGAGLSGLTLALALHQQGIKSKVYESRSAPLNIGGAIMLSPNAMKVLDALGMYQDVRSKGFNFDYLQMQTVDAKPLEIQQFGSIEKYGYQANRIYRFELIDIVLSKIRSLGIEVVYGTKFARIVEETNDHVIWESTDGVSSTASLVVGADGIHSTVRKYLYAALEPKFIGICAVTAAVPKSQVTAPFPLDKPLTIVAPGTGAFVAAPQKVDGSEIFFGKQKRVEEQTREGWDKMLADKEAAVKFLQEGAEVFGELAVTATKAIPHDKINIWPFYMIPKLDRWTSEKRRVLLVGDSAHAIPPSAGQGINQAFEDVYIFSLLLGQSRSGTVKLEDALTFWQQYRQARVDRVLELNKQIDMRRMPKPPGSAAASEQKELEVDWLFAPDFKADVEQWVASQA